MIKATHLLRELFNFLYCCLILACKYLTRLVKFDYVFGLRSSELEEEKQLSVFWCGRSFLGPGYRVLIPCSCAADFAICRSLGPPKFPCSLLFFFLGHSIISICRGALNWSQITLRTAAGKVTWIVRLQTSMSPHTMYLVITCEENTFDCLPEARVYSSTPVNSLQVSSIGMSRIHYKRPNQVLPQRGLRQS